MMIRLLFLLPFTAFALDYCDYRFWQDAAPEDIDKTLIMEDMLEAETDPEMVIFMEGEAICFRKDYDEAGIRAVCFENNPEPPYCYYERRSFLHMAAQHSPDPDVLRKLMEIGMTVYDRDSQGRTPKYFTRFNSAGDLFKRISQEDELEIDLDHLDMGDLDLNYDLPEPEMVERARPESSRPRRRYSSDDLDLDYGFEDESREGIYVNMAVGLTGGQTMQMRSTDNDIPARCTNPLSDPTPYYFCQQGQNAWSNGFPGSGALAAGGAIGYKHGNLRVEVEGALRSTVTDKSDVEFQTDRSIEYAEAHESIGTVDITTEMANVYVDFDEVHEYIKPFIGFGGGRITQSYGYNAYFLRTSNREILELFGRGRHSAGKSTKADQGFVNKSLTTQFIVGVNVPLNEKADLTVKARYLRVPEFSSTAGWDIHLSDPLVEIPILNTPVQYTQVLEGYGMFDVNVGFTFYFGKRK